MTFLDTHVVVWLYAGALELFPPKALSILEEENDLRFSPICELEIQYLFETKRIKTGARVITEELKTRIGLSICTDFFPEAVSVSLNESWTRDPFDRLITSHCKALNASLLTKDRVIHRNYPKAIWAK